MIFNKTRSSVLSSQRPSVQIAPGVVEWSCCQSFVFPITRTSSIPLTTQHAKKHALTTDICIQPSLFHLYTMVVNPTVAKKRLPTTPAVTPASTSTLSRCLPVKTSIAAIRSKRKAAKKHPMVLRISICSLCWENFCSLMEGNVA